MSKLPPPLTARVPPSQKPYLEKTGSGCAGEIWMTFWTILEKIGACWSILDHFGPFWTMLDHS